MTTSRIINVALLSFVLMFGLGSLIFIGLFYISHIIAILSIFVMIYVIMRIEFKLIDCLNNKSKEK